MGFFAPVGDFRFSFAYGGGMFDPDAALPRPNRTLIYLGACVIAGLRLARASQVNVRVRPTGVAIEESVDLAHEIFNRVFRKTYRRLERRRGCGRSDPIPTHAMRLHEWGTQNVLCG